MLEAVKWSQCSKARITKRTTLLNNYVLYYSVFDSVNGFLLRDVEDVLVKLDK